VHPVKSEQNVRVLSHFQLQPPLHHTTLQYITLSKQLTPEVLEQAREDLTGHILEPLIADDGLAQFWKIVRVFVETPISTQTNMATERESLHFFPDQSVVDDKLPLDTMEKDVAVGFCS